MAAILELRGISNITVYLLDTFLPDEIIRDHRKSITRGFFQPSSYQKATQTMLNQNISAYLQHTRVILFKASNVLEEDNHLMKYVYSLKDNNISSCCSHVSLVMLSCTHWNIIKLKYEVNQEGRIQAKIQKDLSIQCRVFSGASSNPDDVSTSEGNISNEEAKLHLSINDSHLH